MKLARKLFLSALVSTFVSNPAFAIPTCEQELEDAVTMCAQLLGEAEKVQKLQLYEIGTQKQIIEGLKQENKMLEVRIEDLNQWYKRPEVVAPFAFFLGITLTALLKK